MTAKHKDSLVLVVIALMALAISIAGDQQGVSQKWNVGLGTTFLVFGIVIKQFPGDLKRPLFWLLICILLVFHFAVLWVILEIALSRVSHVGTLMWSPVAFVQGMILFFLISAVKQKFFRKG
jgi:hypothetical protein